MNERSEMCYEWLHLLFLPINTLKCQFSLFLLLVILLFSTNKIFKKSIKALIELL